MEGLADSGPAPFLTKTYDIVEDPDTNDVVSWEVDGNSFLVRDANAFATEILPRYLEHSDFLTFARELINYGFMRFKDGRNFWGFENKGFRRGQRELLNTIKCRHPLSSPSSSQQGQAPSAACGLGGEVHRLQRDKGTPLAEVVKQRQEQQASGRPIKSWLGSIPTRQRLHISIFSTHTETSDLGMPTSVTNGSHVPVNMENWESRGSSTSLSSGRLGRSMTMPDTGTHGRSGGRHHPERTRGYAGATTNAAYGTGIGVGGVRDARVTEAQQRLPADFDLEAQQHVPAARETEARQRHQFSLFGADSQGSGAAPAPAQSGGAAPAQGGAQGGGAAPAQGGAQGGGGAAPAQGGAQGGGAAPAQEPPEEEARTYRDVFNQVLATSVTGSVMSYPVLKDAPKHVKIIIYGGQVVIIAIVLFAGILPRSLRLAFWLVSCLAVALLTFSLASQLS